MIICNIDNVKKSFGANEIFSKVSFTIQENERVGLVGRNGTGKTTLMKILMGKETCEGQVHFKKGIKIGYLEQIPRYDEELKVVDVLRIAFKQVTEIKEKMEKLEQQLAVELDNIETLMTTYGELQEKYERLGGFDIDEKISKVTVGLKINAEMQNREFNLLSGGEKSKVILGKILLEEPDLLLLDEPSNHLDIDSVEWLENYLKAYKGAVLIISHDRYFLDRVVTKIIEMEGEGVSTYNGNYTYYVNEKEKRFIEAMKHYENQAKKIKRMEDQIKRYRVWGAMRDSEKMYIRAKELEKRLEKIEKLNKPIIEKRKINLITKALDRTSKEVIKVEELEIGFEERTLFKDVSFCVYYQESLGILGGNGVGKTCLLKTMMEEMIPTAGSIKIGNNVKVGYLPQEVVFSNENQNLLDLYNNDLGTGTNEARRELAKALFVKDDVFKQIKYLSGGEKSRLRLSMLLYQQVNVLILDEPTNHLDIDSREMLEETLINYKGTILFVSHDRYFINKIASKIGELNKGCFTVYEGDYDYYKEEKLKIEKKDEEIHKVRVKKKVKKDKNTIQTQPTLKQLEKQLQMVEVAIQDLEEKFNGIEMLMDENQSNCDKLNELLEKYNHYKQELDHYYNEWETLEQEIEKRKNG